MPPSAGVCSSCFAVVVGNAVPLQHVQGSISANSMGLLTPGKKILPCLPLEGSSKVNFWKLLLLAHELCIEQVAVNISDFFMR